MHLKCPGSGNCSKIGLENSRCNCNAQGGYVVGTLSISLQWTCDVPGPDTAPRPQWEGFTQEGLLSRDHPDLARLRSPTPVPVPGLSRQSIEAVEVKQETLEEMDVIALVSDNL